MEIIQVTSRKKGLLSFIGIILILTMPPAWSNESYDFSEADYFIEDIPIVLTASRLKQPITDAPTAVTIIDQQLIRASGVREIPELFRLVPGMQVGYEKGSWPVVSYHGMSDQFSRRMQILVDGRAIYQPDVGGPNWANLPLAIEDIERIEVIRGSNAVTFGSNSFMGVINIITKHSAETVGFYGKVTHGDNEVKSTTVRVGGTTGDFDFRITAKNQSDNYYGRTEDYKESDSANVRAELQADSNNNILFLAGYSDASKKDRNSGSIFDRTSVRQYEQMKWTHTQSTDNEFIIQLFHNAQYQDARYLDRVVDSGVNFDDVVDNTNTERLDAEAQYIFSLNPSIRAIIGAGIRQDKVWSLHGFNSDETFKINIKRLFGNIEYHATSALLMNIGNMFEDHQYASSRSSPRLALNYTVKSGHVLRGSVSRAHRAPVAFERYAEQFVSDSGDTDYIFLMKPGDNPSAERITVYEIGYITKPSKSPFAFDVKIYREELDRIITPYIWWILPPAAPIDNNNNPFPNATSFSNNANAIIDGIETSIDYRGEESRVRLAYSYVDIDYEFYNGVSTVADLANCCVSNYYYDKSAPLHSASLLLSKNISDQLETSLTYYYFDNVQWLGIGDSLPSYERIDLRLSHNIKIKGATGNLSAVVQNAFLNKYQDFKSANYLDTRTYISLSLEY